MISIEPPLLQAHRGAWDSRIRENSLEAFIEARRLGFQMVECDLRISRDLVPVVFHDATLKRTFGKRHRIRTTRWQALQGNFQIPTLHDILTHPQCPELFNLEIKNESLRFDLIEKSVAQVIREAGAERRVIVSSFNPMTLVKMKKLLPKVPVALLVTQEKSIWNTWPLRSLVMEPLVKPDFLHVDCQTFSNRWIQSLAKRYFVSAWTVSDPERGQELLDLGVRSLIVDHLRPKDF